MSSAIKHVAESAGNPPTVGRISPVNMQSETRGLDYESIIGDMTTENDCRGDDDLNSRPDPFRIWA